MIYFKNRRSPRHIEFDYSQPGAYFITICTKDRICLFGEIQDDTMILNAAGRMVERWLLKVPSKFPVFQDDALIIMPNHLHCVLFNKPNDNTPQLDHKIEANPSLSDVIQWLKTMTTNEYIRGVKDLQWNPFRRQLWQRSFYDHVIRNEEELAAFRAYIDQNPLKWSLDKENPDNLTSRF